MFPLLEKAFILIVTTVIVRVLSLTKPPEKPCDKTEERFRASTSVHYKVCVYEQESLTMNMLHWKQQSHLKRLLKQEQMLCLSKLLGDYGCCILHTKTLSLFRKN